MILLGVLANLDLDDVFLPNIVATAIIFRAKVCTRSHIFRVIKMMMSAHELLRSHIFRVINMIMIAHEVLRLLPVSRVAFVASLATKLSPHRCRG